MKIRQFDTLYVQVKDLIFINFTLDELPASLKQRYFGKRRKVNLDDCKDTDFVKITNPSEVMFFERQDYIFDYYSETFRFLQANEIIKKAREFSLIVEKYVEEIYSDIDRFGMNELLFGYHMINYQKLCHKLNEYENLIAAKKGLLGMHIVEEESSPIKNFIGKMLRIS